MDICGLQILIYLIYEIDSLDTLAVLKLLKYGHSFLLELYKDSAISRNNKCAKMRIALRAIS